MEANIFTNVVLPLALAVIMLGLGLTLTRYDFLRVVIFPKAFVIGLTCQMALLPLAGFVIAKLFPMEPQLAVGVMILALCPAGATANLLTYLSRGDVALGITLTAFNSLIIIITTPILINLSLTHFLGETQEIRLPVLRTIIQVGAIILIPVSIGMLIRARKPKLAFAAERPVRYLSMVFRRVYGLLLRASGARGCPRDGVLAAPARVVEPLNLDQIAVRVAGEQVVDVVPLVVGGRLGDLDAVRLQVCCAIRRRRA
jgi:BASS family bile acid:Na+ symporter